MDWNVESAMTPAEFRAALLDAMRNSSTRLNFSELAATMGTDRSVADEVARSVFSRYVAKLVDDGDYTTAERRKAEQLAAILEIPALDAIALAEKMREDRYRAELLNAEADGIITDQEESTLYGLRVALGLSIVPLSSTSRLQAKQQTAADPLNPDTSTATPVALVGRPDSSATSVAQSRTTAAIVNGRLESLNTPAILLAELDTVHDGDKDAEKKQRLWTWASAGFLVPGVFLFIFAIISVQEFGNVIFVLPAACAVAGVISLILRSYHVRRNLNDRRYTIARSVLEYLSRDIDRQDTVALNVDFNHYKNRQYRSDDTKESFFWSTRTMEYELPWLAMKGRFVDGTRFRLSVTQDVKRKEKRKRKYTKVSESFRDKISLTLQVKPGRVAHLPMAVQMLQGSRMLKAGLILHSVSTIDNRLTIQTVTPRQCRTSGRGTNNSDAEQKTSNHHDILKLFLACYDALGRAIKAGAAA